MQPLQRARCHHCQGHISASEQRHLSPHCALCAGLHAFIRLILTLHTCAHHLASRSPSPSPSPSASSRPRPTRPTTTAPRSALEMAKMSLFEASKSGDHRTVQQLLDSGLNPDVRDARGQTPLMIAAENNLLRVVKKLLRSRADINADCLGLYPLDYAARSTAEEVATYLASKGAVHGPSATQHGLSPLAPHFGSPSPSSPSSQRRVRPSTAAAFRPALAQSNIPSALQPAADGLILAGPESARSARSVSTTKSDRLSVGGDVGADPFGISDDNTSQASSMYESDASMVTIEGDGDAKVRVKRSKAEKLFSVFDLRRYKNKDLRKLEDNIKKADKIHKEMKKAEKKAEQAHRELVARTEVFKPKVDSIRQQVMSADRLDGIRSGLAAATAFRKECGLSQEALEVLQWPGKRIQLLETVADAASVFEKIIGTARRLEDTETDSNKLRRLAQEGVTRIRIASAEGKTAAIALTCGIDLEAPDGLLTRAKITVRDWFAAALGAAETKAATLASAKPKEQVRLAVAAYDALDKTLEAAEGALPELGLTLESALMQRCKVARSKLEEQFGQQLF
mmetsp:Transcript_20990/g.49776  ORF Transcript_20990/g.49776 Transcript_20990/m.49776 type:complete len:569 (-) Transcript_20990:92-1798(-)